MRARPIRGTSSYPFTCQRCVLSDGRRIGDVTAAPGPPGSHLASEEGERSRGEEAPGAARPLLPFRGRQKEPPSSWEVLIREPPGVGPGRARSPGRKAGSRGTQPWEHQAAAEALGRHGTGHTLWAQGAAPASPRTRSPSVEGAEPDSAFLGFTLAVNAPTHVEKNKLQTANHRGATGRGRAG